MSTLFASFVTVTMPLTGGSSLFVDNHATTSAPSPSSLIFRHQLCRLPCCPPPLPCRRGCRRCRSSLWFFPSSARHRHHPQDPALSLQISFLSSTVQPPLLSIRLLSLADEDVAAASLLSGSFLRRLAIAASLLSSSFLHRLAIAAIPKIQHCRCRSPPSSFPPPSSCRFLTSTSSPSPTRMSLPPLFSLVLSFVGSPSPPLFSPVLSVIGSPSPPSPTAVADLLPLPLLHRPAAASCSSLAMLLLLASSPLSTFSFSFSVDLTPLLPPPSPLPPPNLSSPSSSWVNRMG